MVATSTSAPHRGIVGHISAVPLPLGAALTIQSTNNVRRFAVSALAVGLGIAISVAGASQAYAFPTSVDLGAAQGFAVLGHTTVTNTGPSLISGDLGVTPGSSAPGFPPGQMLTGNIHISDGPAGDAMAAATAAYTDAAGRTPPDSSGLTDLANKTLVGGLYKGGALSNTGTLVLDGAGNANSVWIFQADSTLITNSSSVVSLINGANPCNVFWQVTSSTTLGTNSTMVGTIISLTSISASTGASVDGRLFALNGAVTLDDNRVTVPATCAGTIAPGGTKTSPLAATGIDIRVPLFASLTLAFGGAVLLLVSGTNSRRRRGGRLAA
jgi:hypothetical protein